MIHVTTLVSVVPAPSTTAFAVSDHAVAVTVPDHQAVLAIVTVQADHVQPVVRVILDPSISCTDHHDADSVTVWLVASDVFVIVWLPVFDPLCVVPFIFTVHDPFETSSRSILVSPPVAESVGQVPVAALLIVNSFTALGTEVVGNLISSLLPPSLI